jgi:hypothetical protein
MKRKPKLDKVAPKPRPKFVMSAPNDDAAAYGWTLGKLRHPPQNPKDALQGPLVFDVPTDYATRQVYGHNIEFICPAYIQLLLDAEPAVRAGAEKVKAAGYSPEALKEFSETIIDVFKKKILPDVVRRFEGAAGMVAQFYAARLAHIDKFGHND